jgi:hypothetical protein
MKTSKQRFIEKINQYHFELRHVLVLFVIFVAVQVLVSFVQKISLQEFLVDTQDSYQKDSAERVANLTATSLELLLEAAPHALARGEEGPKKIIEAFNIILSQQLLLQHVDEVCVLVAIRDQIFAIDNGRVLYEYFFANPEELPPPDLPHDSAIQLYKNIRTEMIASEQVRSILEGRQTFHVFVPFVPKGEYAGAVYIKNTPDFTFITKEIIAGFNESSLIFTGLMLFGLLAMFYVSSYTVRERDEAQQLLFKERENQLEERIHYQKETMFAKRIYHTHHKAEKVMGFIKEDLIKIAQDNIEEIKYRVTKYANFISRVIYDMKWYEPPIQAIRNPIFKTDLNEVIQFVVNNICLRSTRRSELYKFELDLDPNLPPAPINEFVVWEILEPLFQNSMDHNADRRVIISVKTSYDATRGESKIMISDNGSGILPELLETNENGVKRIFLESISTKKSGQNSGYGCYIAHEIATERCGWKLDVENLAAGGCRFTIVVPSMIDNR